MADVIQEWRTATPLWGSILAGNGNADATALVRPAILRFASDSFMEDFLAVLEREPSRLDGFVAQEETWQRPMPVPTATKRLLEPTGPVSLIARQRATAKRVARGGAGSLVESTGDGGSDTAWPQTPVKLYHPAHQRYYLVTGSLVCRMVGLPDRMLNPARDERASFVVRRLLPASPPGPGEGLPAVNADAWEEYAFVASPDGHRWRRLGTPDAAASTTLVAGEERHRLFGTRFTDDVGQPRQVFAGLVPVGSREAYLAAPLGEPLADAAAAEDGWEAAASPPPDPRLTLARIQVIEPWRNLIDQAESERYRLDRVDEPALPDALGSPPASDRTGGVRRLREQIQTASWYILLDFAAFLERELPAVWQDLQTGSASPAPGSLLEALRMPVPVASIAGLVAGSAYSTSDVRTTLTSALLAVVQKNDHIDVPGGLEGVETPYDRVHPAPDWPAFLFPLVDPEAVDLETVVPPAAPFDPLRAVVDVIETRLEAALAASPAAGMLPALPSVSATALDARDGWFVIRFVFEQPNCGKVKPPLLSAPTAPFQLAPFFDPDAPARPIRISLPSDTSPAGLRKFAKNTVFQFSDMLCGQVGTLKKLTFGDLVRSVLPWPFHKDLPLGEMELCKGKSGGPAGMACSLSIPIVTICALILLIMIVSLLDFFFKWIPYFIACFPIPGLKGKKP